MFCHKCGEDLPGDSYFCSSCGAKIVKKEEQQVDEQIKELNNEQDDKVKQYKDELAVTSESANQLETVSNQQYKTVRPKPPTRKTFSFWLSILIPVISLLFLAAGIVYYYLHEMNINKQVLALQVSAEVAALNNDFASATEDLTKAIDLRPNYFILQGNMKEIEKAADFTGKLANISKKIQEKQYDEAEELLTAFKEELEKEPGILFIMFNDQVAKIQMTITVVRIRDELDKLTTVTALANKLSTITATKSEEATVLREQIINKIIQISTDQATASLEKKQFPEALSTINQGLEYATDNQKLLAFKDEIKSAQTDFERAEQKLIEDAMEVAAREDLKIRTDAVEITSFYSSIDIDGDILVSGEVLNKATRDIYSITINYTAYDEDGSYIDSSYATVFPYYLSPGETGYFEDYIFLYSLYDNVNVEIDNITWDFN